MLITESNDRSGELKWGNFFLDEDFIVRDMDVQSQEYLGEIRSTSVLDLLTASEDEINSFSAMLKEQGNARILTITKDRYERNRLLDLQARRDETGAFAYHVVFWDITNTELDYGYYYENVWKYRIMLGLSGSTFFDYNLDTGIMAVYRYVTHKSILLYRDTFESFEKDLRALSEQDDKNRTAIDMFLHNLAEGSNSLECTIRTGLFHKDKKIQKLKVHARFDDMNLHRMMFGTLVNMSTMEDDVPYYMTAAGLDSMTGLLNKRSLLEYSEDILTNPANASRTHYMVLLDIDDFKKINDNYGHQVGDQAIQVLATALTDVVTDLGIIGRFGGDEFYILTDRIADETQLRNMLRAIRLCAVARAKEQLGIDNFSLSMGVSQYPVVGTTYDELFALADKCLYIAKEKGKNRYIIYRPEMHRDVQTGSIRKGTSSFDEQAKALNKTVHALFREGASAIETHLKSIVKAFDLDNIDIFYGEGLPVFYTCGKYASGFKASDFTSVAPYMELFDANGLYVMNNFNNHKKFIPGMYNLLFEHKCMSLIQIALPSVTAPEYLISFNVQNRIHKWSDSEISNLNLLGTLIYDALKK